MAEARSTRASGRMLIFSSRQLEAQFLHSSIETFSVGYFARYHFAWFQATDHRHLFAVEMRQARNCGPEGRKWIRMI